MFKYLLSLLIVLSLSCNPDERRQSEKIIKTSLPAKEIRAGYEEVKSKIANERINFRESYKLATEKEKKDLDSVIKDYLVQVISDELYSYWQGTPYDFNGTTATPGQGKIACGFFVTGVLKDAGVQLQRRTLSICPSLVMMKALANPKNIKNLSSLDYDQFTSWTKKYGKALFIAGLDYHTGFIVNDGTETWFIHSNYINKEGVTKERIEGSIALRSSITRYLVCLTDDQKFLQSWLFH
jgi:hypothetical protein